MTSATTLAEFLTRSSVERPNPIAVASPYSDRACSAAATFERIEPFLAAHGVTRLGRLTGLDAIGIPVWQAVSPNSRSIVINQGKGITDIDAKVSAAMEALERAVAGDPKLETVVTSRNRLSRDAQRADPLPSLIATGEADVEDDEEIPWACGFDLIAGHNVWVPRQASTLDRTTENPRFWQSSDGLASGNNLTEAILHGLLERIERDAEVLWSVSEPEARMTACIDPASLHDPVLDALAARIEAAGLTLRLFDVTSDIGVPAFVALIGPHAITLQRRPRYLDVTNGSGAHPSHVRAAIRAVTEAAQSRLTFISGARDDIRPETFLRELPEDIRRCFDAIARPAAAKDMPAAAGASALLELTLEHLRRAGIVSAVALPLSDPSLPFAVAKIFVPQLENPVGDRKRRIGFRALSRSLQLL